MYVYGVFTFQKRLKMTVFTLQKKSLTKEQAHNLRRIGHSLKPVVLMGGSGVTDNLIAEINRALNDHELIKIKLLGEDRHERKEILAEITEKTNSIAVQNVGKMALIYKKNPNANPKLSNIVRYSV